MGERPIPDENYEAQPKATSEGAEISMVDLEQLGTKPKEDGREAAERRLETKKVGRDVVGDSLETEKSAPQEPPPLHVVLGKEHAMQPKTKDGGTLRVVSTSRGLVNDVPEGRSRISEAEEAYAKVWKKYYAKEGNAESVSDRAAFYGIDKSVLDSFEKSDDDGKMELLQSLLDKAEEGGTEGIKARYDLGGLILKIETEGDSVDKTVAEAGRIKKTLESINWELFIVRFRKDLNTGEVHLKTGNTREFEQRVKELNEMFDQLDTSGKVGLMERLLEAAKHVQQRRSDHFDAIDDLLAMISHIKWGTLYETHGQEVIRKLHNTPLSDDKFVFKVTMERMRREYERIQQELYAKEEMVDVADDSSDSDDDADDYETVDETFIQQNREKLEARYGPDRVQQMLEAIRLREFHQFKNVISRWNEADEDLQIEKVPRKLQKLNFDPEELKNEILRLVEVQYGEIGGTRAREKINEFLKKESEVTVLAAEAPAKAA